MFAEHRSDLFQAAFEEPDLLERGQRLIDESVNAGVTHMRAFVEVDSIVKSKCLDAGLQLKRKAEKEGRCRIQLCAFAQLPINSSEKDEDDHEIRSLLESAAANDEIEAVGATPYVESNEERSKWNIDYMIQLCIQHNKHLDFHLDFSMDASIKPMVHYVCERLKHHNWNQRTTNRTISLGHCTRLSLEPSTYFADLAANDLDGLPVSFVGIPTSDLFMGWSTSPHSRGTLKVPQLIKEHNIQACISVNNVGNAFTPHGSCDPLTLACKGVGIYQAGTEKDAEILYECVSTRAKKAIGLSEDGRTDLEVREGDRADFVVFGTEREEWRTRKTITEAVYLYDHVRGREAYFAGKQISGGSRGL